MSELKQERDYLEYLKDKISFRLFDSVTASSFKQRLKAIDKINSELAKINKSLKESR